MAEKSSEKPKSVAITRERTDQTILYYANDTWIAHTQYEVQINFGQIFALPPNTEIPDRINVQAGVTIIMSLEHAEAALKALQAQVEKAKARKAESTEAE